MKIELENFDTKYAELKEELLDAICGKIDESENNEISVGGWVNNKPLRSIYKKYETSHSYFAKVEECIVTGDNFEHNTIEYQLCLCTIDELLNIYRNILYGN